MFEQVFKNIDDILHKDAGCGSELDYVEQTSWILFLKYLDDLEKDKETAALLSGKTYEKIIETQFQWTTWAAPKLESGKIDHNAMTGDDLVDFVNGELFPYLKKFKKDAESANTIEYKIGEIFSELKNRIQSGYNLREVANLIDELRFRTHAEKHEMSHLYEGKIKNMGNAGRNGGEYYTPRPLIKTIVKVVAPKIGETIYDGAVGSAGFLVEAFEYLNKKGLSTSKIETLQKKTFFGKEKKSLAYIIGIMNMILHGVEAPNIIHTNTLAENLSDIQEKDRYNVILANPPFGGKERAEVQQNFPIKTGETASLFLQHFIKILKAGGKAGVVIKNTFLSNTDNASIALRNELLSNCDLHTVLDLPGGTFTGAGVKTVVLFFEKGKKTQKTWFYQLNLDRNLGKTNPLNEKDLAEFVELQKTQAKSENSWTINIADIDQTTFDLSVKNPNKKDFSIIREPNEIQTEIKEIEETSHLIFNNIDSSLKSIFDNITDEFPLTRIGDVCEVIAGQSPEGKYYNKENKGLPFYQGKKEFNNKFIGEPTTWTTKITKEAIKDDILMSVRAPVGPVNIATEKICIGRGLAAIRASNQINVDFLYYFFLKNESDITGNTGAVFNSINKSQIADLKIPLPPIKTQIKIVETLNIIFNELEKLDILSTKKDNNLLELRKSIMKIAFNEEF